MDLTIVSDSRCIMCHVGEAVGPWQLCPGCRRRIADLSAQRKVKMAPGYRLGCLTPKRTPPKPGSIYCPRCFAIRRKQGPMTMFALRLCDGPPCPSCGCRDGEIIEPASGYAQGAVACRFCGRVFHYAAPPDAAGAADEQTAKPAAQAPRRRRSRRWGPFRQ